MFSNSSVETWEISKIQTSRSENYNVWYEKNILDEINIRLDITEERNSDLEDIEIEAHKPPKCQQTPNIKGMKKITNCILIKL